MVAGLANGVRCNEIVMPLSFFELCFIFMFSSVAMRMMEMMEMLLLMMIIVVIIIIIIIIIVIIIIKLISKTIGRLKSNADSQDARSQILWIGWEKVSILNFGHLSM